MSLNCPQCQPAIPVDSTMLLPTKLRCSNCGTSFKRYGGETVRLVRDAGAVTYVRAGFRSWCERNPAGVMLIGGSIAAVIQMRLAEAVRREKAKFVDIELSKEKKVRQQTFLKELMNSDDTKADGNDGLRAEGVIGRDVKEYAELIELAERVSENGNKTGQTYSFRYGGVGENGEPNDEQKSVRNEQHLPLSMKTPTTSCGFLK